jgi:hypothetical protein
MEDPLSLLMKLVVCSHTRRWSMAVHLDGELGIIEKVGR